MFLELHLYENNKKFIVNLNKVNTVYMENEITAIYIGDVVYRIKESYSEIVDAIGSYYSYI